MLNFAILTISDRAAAGTRADVSGPALAQALGGRFINQIPLLPERIMQEVG